MCGGKGGQPCVIKPPCSGTWYMKQVDERNSMHPSPYPDRIATLEIGLRGYFGRATRLADGEFCNVELSRSFTPWNALYLYRNTKFNIE